MVSSESAELFEGDVELFAAGLVEVLELGLELDEGDFEGTTKFLSRGGAGTQATEGFVSLGQRAAGLQFLFLKDAHGALQPFDLLTEFGKARFEFQVIGRQASAVSVEALHFAGKVLAAVGEFTELVVEVGAGRLLGTAALFEASEFDTQLAMLFGERGDQLLEFGEFLAGGFEGLFVLARLCGLRRSRG